MQGFFWCCCRLECCFLLCEKAVEGKAAGDPAGQFKDAILAVASGLNAGYSVENAFAVSLKEMEEIHGSDP